MIAVSSTSELYAVSIISIYHVTWCADCSIIVSNRVDNVDCTCIYEMQMDKPDVCTIINIYVAKHHGKTQEFCEQSDSLV